jgi:hypothetical protein
MDDPAQRERSGSSNDLFDFSRVGWIDSVMVLTNGLEGLACFDQAIAMPLLLEL